jgi:hypothetical protein
VLQPCQTLFLPLGQLSGILFDWTLRHLTHVPTQLTLMGNNTDLVGVWQQMVGAARDISTSAMSVPSCYNDISGLRGRFSCGWRLSL